MGIEKWVGAGLGWAFGGPIGALIGFTLGSWLGSDNKPKRIADGERRTRYNTTTFDFKAALLVLTAAIMKADKRVVKSELDFVKAYFKQNFGVEQTKRDMILLRDLLKQDIDVLPVVSQIRYSMTIAHRRYLFSYLVGIAVSDNHLDQRERIVLQQIASGLGLSQAEFNSAMAVASQEPKVSPYVILEIPESATDDEVKKAYRSLARKYHPDRVASLGPEHVSKAEEKFKKMKQAYEEIKEQRNLN